ncbi:MAG TPA: hypothetical protein DHV62_01135, partial [Elusimicrobia bacterium]|nr:hypothetical protein [Elusimicrobiota bacterium]
MNKLFLGLIFLLIMTTPSMAANVPKVEIHGVVYDEKSNIYNKTSTWDAQNFTGFWYSIHGGKSSETLKIENINIRSIDKENLKYSTSRTDQKYIVFIEKGKKVENALDFDNVTKKFNKTNGGYYARLGWFGDLYVALNGKSNKLSKLLLEQKKDQKKTLKLGESWNLGEGFNITAVSLDTKTNPRQALLNLTKNDRTLDNKVVYEGDVYTYVVKNLQGESDVPIFVTYIESIFTGAEGAATFVQLRYTWLISDNVTEIKLDDKFGELEVKESNEERLILSNDGGISLSLNAVKPIYNDLKIRVADHVDLRFYPILEKTIPGKYEIRGGVYDEIKYKSLVWDAQRFPAFWYALPGGKSSETLEIENVNILNSTNRVIDKEKLIYSTIKVDRKYDVFIEKGKKVDNALEYNSTTKTFVKANQGSYYARLGWFGNVYVAVNGKSNKLSKLILEQKKEEKKLLKIGDSWDLGELNLTVQNR